MLTWSRVRNVFRRDLNDDIDAELRSHFEEAAAAGRDPLEARRAFGSRMGTRDAVRDDVVAVWLESWCLDLRHAVRELRRSPVFAATAVLTVALGVGATTAVFTLIQQVMFRTLPVAHPERLWRIGDAARCCYSSGYTQSGDDTPNHWSLFSWDAYQGFRANTPAFEELAAFQIGTGNGELAVRRMGSAAPVQERLGQYVSGNFFRTFGIAPWRGRLFTDADDVDGAPLVAVMSFRTWQDGYASDPDVIGAAYEINGHPFTVIGVAPPGFYGAKVDAGTMPDVWLPLALEPVIAGATSRLKNPSLAWLDLIGRVREGTNPARLEAQLRGELRQWLAGHRPEMSAREQALADRQTLRLAPGRAGVSLMRGQYADGLRLLLIAAACVLLLACANIANLWLARGWRHAHQTAVRVAMGASAARLVRGALLESTLLGIAGGVAGMAVSYGGAGLILQLAFSDEWVPVSAAPSLPMLVFALTLSIVTGLVFGIAPAWMRSRTHPTDAVRVAPHNARNTTFAQKTLVIAQVTASVVLLSAAAMLGQSLRNLERRDLGFSPDGRYLVSIDTRLSNYRQEQLQPLFDDISTRLRRIPGVKAASAALYAPLSGLYWGHDISISGRAEPGAGENVSSAWTRVAPDFFDTIGDRIVMGRAFAPSDNASGRRVAVVNEAFARKFFANENPVGRFFGPAPSKNAGLYEIVGVAADVQYFASNGSRGARPIYFLPSAQSTTFTERELQSREVWSHYPYAIVVFAPGSSPTIAADVRQALTAAAPDLVVRRIQPYADVVQEQFAQEQMIATLSWIFAAIGLALAAIGLYGITAYRVEQQTNDIGVRMALGSSRRAVVVTVLRNSVLPVCAGIALGIPAAVGTGLLMANQLFGVKPWDPAILIATPLLLMLATLIAAALPARRAASVNPLKALRAD